MQEIYCFLWPAKAMLDKAKRLIIATDRDSAGEALGAERARRIGRERCWNVVYPDGCKDANDVLMRDGAEELYGVWEDADPWPVEGLFEASDFFDESDKLFVEGFADKLSTGIPAVDELFSPSPGLLTIVTGILSHGKSTFVDQLLVNLAKEQGWV